jgi:hypothetical protein
MQLMIAFVYVIAGGLALQSLEALAICTSFPNTDFDGHDLHPLTRRSSASPEVCAMQLPCFH